jgi:hypothetical protein
MKPDDYNPKAREALGNSLIRLGEACMKSILLLILTLPISIMAPIKFPHFRVTSQ